MPFEHVQYWQELTQILHWSQTRIQETLTLLGRANFALSSQGAKHDLPQKISAFPASNRHTQYDFLAGFNDVSVPVSRHSETRRKTSQI